MMLKELKSDLKHLKLDELFFWSFLHTWLYHGITGFWGVLLKHTYSPPTKEERQKAGGVFLQIQAEMPSLLALVIEAMQKHASAPEVHGG